MPAIKIGNRLVGTGQPCFVGFDIGINHDGDIDTALHLIDLCVDAGADFVKFQKRTPELQVHTGKRDVLRDSPWGIMSTLEYRQRIELSEDDYETIRDYCDFNHIIWFASAWDLPAFEFLESMGVVAHKVASAKLNDTHLLEAMRDSRKPIIMSTGMSTIHDIYTALDHVGDNVMLMACTSDYPCADEDINLPTIWTLADEFGLPVGYSGHEGGILASVLAAGLFDACVVERHCTLDRSRKGSDHGASLEPLGMAKLVRDIRRAEKLLAADGVKRITDGELKQIERLRGTIATH